MKTSKELLTYAVELDNISILRWMVNAGEHQNNPKMKKCLHNVLREENERFNKYFSV